MFKQQEKKDIQDSVYDSNFKRTNDEYMYDHPLESEGYQELGVFNQGSLYDKLD